MRVSTSHMQDTGVQNMTGQQTQINESQNQLSSGRRLQRPSDDPASAARVLDLERTIESIERFNRNGELAENRLTMSEAALDQAGNHLQRIRELTIQAANDSQDEHTRSYIASEVEQRFEQLVQLANSQDGNGEYLFAGSKTRTQPFNLRENGAVEYVGDQASRSVRIGPARTMAVDNSGFEAFMKIPNGNGQFDARPAPDNTGRGLVTVVDRDVRSIDPQDGEFRIQFVEDADGQLRYGVQRTGGSEDPEDWEWVQPPTGGRTPSIEETARYEPGAAIEVTDGVRVEIQGEPAEGDQFIVSQSRPQSVFETVNDLVGALKQGEGTEFRNTVDRALGDLDQALENTYRIRADLGARMSSLDAEQASNEAALVDLREAKSSEEDLDYAEATGRFNQELAGLQAAQSTFSRVQDLSLFNYI